MTKKVKVTPMSAQEILDGLGISEKKAKRILKKVGV